MTWFRPEGRAEDAGAPLLQRRRRAWEAVQPLPPREGCWWPGTWPAPEPAGPDPAALPVARFVGRRAKLAEGVTWIEGRIEAPGAGQTLRRKVGRLVLEGEAPDLLRLGAELARTLPLLPAGASLAEEALALAEDRAPRPRRSGPPSLAGAQSVEPAFLAAMAHLQDVLLAETPRCRLEQGPRGVHQSRVAIRRLRSILKLFRPVVDGPDWRAWDAQLGDLARALGSARDWDVFLGGIGAGTLEALDGDIRLKRLLRAALRERDAAYAALGRLLAGEEFRRTVWLGLQLALIRPHEVPNQPLAPFAAELLRKRWRRLKRAGAAMSGLDASALHEMRLDAKRLRYAAEPFSALWPGRASKRFTRRLAALQEALGLANDATVARGLAARLAGRGAGSFAIGTVTGFAAGRAEGSRIASIVAWKALKKAGPFWKTHAAADT
ncbi:CHAD domain-containing protein [Roseococcus sp. SYP-B2431]|uniref:CYTH and CHAD domain-containing protein n=1 Tax=Roseococcus sp. SYP-B2431 TaxID=2496640 RepID=UPI00103E5E71|nr:CHAD domain-containing protein [Roseococcus sp. SYP-B2431]TCH99959.1 CHAD domain-containing protein [Roseococcus sp. SYP-B2431]